MYEIIETKESLLKEFFYFIEKDGVCSLRNNHNKIIKFFQQKELYKKELELLCDKNILNKIIKNRCFYLNKEEKDLTTIDILDGFKKSGIYYGYSMFNPLLAKWFFNEFNCKICYDPCGGWGHRMLGATELDEYIYNDISLNVANNVNEIKFYFDIPNVTIYNNDCNFFSPKENFDSMFTCPPYYNIEKYQGCSFKNIDEYYFLLKNIFNCFLNKKSCVVFGIVLREDLIFGEYKKFSYSFKLTKNSPYHLTKKNKHTNDEYLYVYKK